MKRVIPAVVAVLGVAFLVGLGLWQLDRRDWKQDLIQAADAGIAAPPLAVGRLADIQPWRRATLSGAWAETPPVRIAPKTFNGKVGGDFVALFKLDSGEAVAVRLGWAPDGAAPPAPSGAADGVLLPPPRPNLFTPDNRPPDQWLWLEPARIASTAGLAADKTAALILNLDSSPPGLSARPAKPKFANNHLQYAFTWFGLAAALAVVAFFRLRKGRD